MIDVSSMNEDERNDYIFGDHIDRDIPVTNRFGWLESALPDDIETFINVIRIAPQLRVGGGNLSIPIIVCTGLELVSALYAGNTKYLCGRAYNAEDNVKNFVKNFFTGPAREIPRLIWDGVRNGVDHTFNPKSIQYSNDTIRFTFYSEIEMQSYVSKNNNEIRIHLNSIELYNMLRRAVSEYRIELQGTKELQENFIWAWNSIESSVQNVTNRFQQAMETRSLLRRLQTSNNITPFH